MKSSKINLIIKKLQKCLSRDLLSPKYKKIISNNDCIVSGHCAIATEALYYILGGKEKGFSPRVFSYIEGKEKLTHWWLVDKEGNIIDPTSEQYNNDFKYYSSGRKIGFMQPQKQPSKRAKTLIDRYNNRKTYK